MGYDVCVIGSGAGAGPIFYELSKAGYKVLVLEKGPWIRTSQWSKDEMSATRRDVFQPNLNDEQHVVENKKSNGQWDAQPTSKSKRDLWNGNTVGGSSNFMSAYFHRLKPNDFRLLSEYGPIKGANIVDWPISYDEMEPYYTKVEEVIGVSGKVVPHKFLEPRSTPDYPFPPLNTNIVADWYKKAGEELGIQVFPAARGIISKPHNGRNACYHSNYCGSFGCSSDGKGSSRAALLPQALESGNCEVIPNAKVYNLETDESDNIVKAWYYDIEGNNKSVEAKIFVVACQAVESARLLLMSKSERFPNGLANNHGQVGKNLVFASGGAGSGIIRYDSLSEEDLKKFSSPLSFVNQCTQDFYEFENKELGRVKGGTIDFLLEHSAPIPKTYRNKFSDGALVYGSELKEKVHDYFTNQKRIKYEVFCDWLPTDDCYVTLDDEVKDKWGDPVGRVRLGFHDHDIKIGNFLSEKAKKIMKQVGAEQVAGSVTGYPSTNLMAGGCRFGNDPKTSVLDKNCKAHEVDNLYVTDGSFMPTGGSVPHTLTIYANSFRVADQILKKLGESS